MRDSLTGRDRKQGRPTRREDGPLCRKAELAAFCVTLAFLVLTCVPIESSARSDTPRAFVSSSTDTTRILFLGNSYTYRNNLPEIIAKLAEAGEQGKVIYRMITPDGWRLKDHWVKGEAREALRGEQWDYVVLQDQSTLGIYYIFEGRDRLSTDSIFRPYAYEWAREIHECGAIPVFYLTWVREWAPEDQPILNNAYMDAAERTHSVLAPVGIAWEHLRRSGSDVELYDEDGSHPSPAGSYLAGCTFYSTVFGESPIGLPCEIRGAPFNSDSEVVESEKTELLVGLSEQQAKELQISAWAAVQSSALSYGVQQSLSVPPAAALPSLPPGMDLIPLDLKGTWRGRINFFDQQEPVDMILEIGLKTTGLSDRLVFQYNSSELKDDTVEILDLKVERQVLSFSNPDCAKADSLRVEFQAVVTDEGLMMGRAEAKSTHADPPVHYLGSWSLVRD
jgi:hypothetical protein